MSLPKAKIKLSVMDRECNVELDGHTLKGVKSINITKCARDIPILSLEILVSSVDIDTTGRVEFNNTPVTKGEAFEFYKKLHREFGEE